MALTVRNPFRNHWNIFNDGRYASLYGAYATNGSTSAPKRIVNTTRLDNTVLNVLITRIANDVAAVKIEHVKVDDEGRYMETVDDELNQCLNLEANIDQTSRQFIRDVVWSCANDGYIAIVPIDTDGNPYSERFIVESLRVGKILEWFPDKIRVEVYNERKGVREQVVVSKRYAAVIENPFYPVMNEPNSTMQRLIAKQNLIDKLDNQRLSGKLDIIIQLPYSTRQELRKKQAEERRAEIERQLTDAKYGIAYTDSQEKIIQLNRPLESNLPAQIDTLTTRLYSQMGMTEDILSGTANSEVMQNYNTRVVAVWLDAIVDSMKRTFLTQTARSQHHTIMYFIDPFKNVSADKVADLGDKLIRNEILTKNEFRQILGRKPSDDPNADRLSNPNMPQQEDDMNVPPEGYTEYADDQVEYEE